MIFINSNVINNIWKIDPIITKNNLLFLIFIYFKKYLIPIYFMLSFLDIINVPINENCVQVLYSLKRNGLSTNSLSFGYVKSSKNSFVIFVVEYLQSGVSSIPPSAVSKFQDIYINSCTNRHDIKK